MKLLSTKKLKSLLLTGTISLSLFLGGCVSQQTTDNITIPNVYTTSKENIPNGSIEATVDRVVDGDTMKLKLTGEDEVITLRLLLVDTPESVKPGVEPQPYSKEASNFAKEVLKEGDTVYIEYDSGEKTDKYNRHLVYLWYYSKEDNDWKMYNEKIVEEGLARVGYIYSQKKYLNTLYKAQDKAKAKKLNIWSVDGYVTNRGFDVDTFNKKSTSSNNSETVYANGGSSSSKKYHSSEHAHGMKGAIKMTESKAKEVGYEPCQLCY